MTATACWADTLTRKERTELARMLARACRRFYNTPAGNSKAMLSQIVASAEMSDLHLDVTERAGVPPEVLERASRRASELAAAADDPDWLGI